MAKNKNFGNSVLGMNFGRDVESAAKEKRALMGSTAEYRFIPANKIRFSPYNEGLDSDAVQEYAQSMREQGMIEPIVVYDMGDGTYEILSGHRRYNAWCGILGHETIRAVVREYENDPRKRFKAHTEANSVTRNKDLNYWLTRIKWAKQILRETGFNGSREDELRELSEMLGGVSRMQLYRYESFDRLIPELKEFEARKWLSALTLHTAASLDTAQQKKVAERVMALYRSQEERLIETGMDFEITRADFDRIVKEVKNGKKDASRKRPTYGEKVGGAAKACIKALKAQKTEADKREALRQIGILREELDKLEKEYAEQA